MVSITIAAALFACIVSVTLSICPEDCNLNYAPVCGSDGLTYPNLCALEVVQCKENPELTKVHDGPCLKHEQKQDVEEPVKCEPSMKSCICTLEYAPICASDGNTYGNTCDFCYHMYLKEELGEQLEKKHFGECEPEDYCPPSSRKGLCTFEYSPVCANDGVTYPNLCTMCAAMYKKLGHGENANLKVMYHDECKNSKTLTELICDEKYKSGVCTKEYAPICATNGKTYGNKCTFCYAKFQANENGGDLSLEKFGTCTEPIQIDCKDSDKTGACTRDYSPICGSNGKTYLNRCLFCYAKYQSEAVNNALIASHLGICKVPLLAQSQKYDVLCMEKDKQGACTKELSPLCGTDGKTYSNRCVFCYAKYQAEQNEIQLGVSHIGVCESPKSKDDVQCLESDKNGICTDEYFPICGTDGKTHANRCMFCYAKYLAEQNGNELSVDHIGQCKARKSKHEMKCKESNKAGICTEEYFPICGNDGKTYGNPCTFCYAKYLAEQNGDELDVSHVGKCKVEQSDIPEVKCRESDKFGVCTKELSPICGSDGNTYDNRCIFCNAKYHAAQNGEMLTAVSIGVCKIPQNQLAEDEPECTELDKKGACTRDYSPLCGTDGKTYSNRCVFCYNKYAKESNGEDELRVSHRGSCIVKPKCAPTSKAGLCTFIYKPVCSNEGMTYANECVLCADMFKRQTIGGEDIILYINHDGEC